MAIITDESAPAGEQVLVEEVPDAEDEEEQVFIITAEGAEDDDEYEDEPDDDDDSGNAAGRGRGDDDIDDTPTAQRRGGRAQRQVQGAEKEAEQSRTGWSTNFARDSELLFPNLRLGMNLGLFIGSIWLSQNYGYLLAQ